ncbi:hypothetical protein FCU45_11175 [Sulfurimonas crateris]|uniref:Uncharacterized protein n=1 Tax=Sulfurimonas crateris TaxID=2574727 RepID=A0A4U2Z448_9BACT|nr:hypothetical protein [Sulfurimonas crateris]TKI68260.1 hypothetical protein FCU45_11175 [Sulfurimonas crateris]
MNVSSATQTGYTQATNKTTAPDATSAYESTTSTQTEQTDKIAEIQNKEEPTKATTGVQNKTQEPIITTQQEIEIKQQVAPTMSETEESPLATAIQESSQTQSAKESQATGKMAEMQEKYKDVYTPIPETYSKTDEELQTRKVHEAYPNYISGPEFLKIVSSFLEGTRIELGQKLTPEQEEAQKLDYAQAFQKAYDIFGGEEAFIEMQKGAHEIMKKYPVNSWGKDERVHNATELARFTNAATYEGLEQGKTIEEARIYAANLRSSFMDTSYSTINFLETLIKAGRADPDSLKWFLDQDEKYYPKNPNDIDFNYVNNQTMDLRKYGIEGSWEYYEKPENQKAMIEEIEKKIGQFNFMLNNENLIKDAYSKLVANAQDLGNNAGYKKMINDDYMPRMVDGLNIFKNYTIYDN